MRFYDKVEVQIQSGRWWNWVVAARREKWIPFWWPAWWDWWKWWSVILISSKDINTLIDFSYIKKYHAKNWEDWKSSDKYWKDAEDLILKIPIWTVVKDKNTDKILFQFTEDWQKYDVVKWWKWWLWNIHFKNSVRQYPNFALFGEPSQKKEIVLELQMLWDVALIGTPSVGKSTIINTISNVKAKVADYPFTTIIPNLWVVKTKDYNFSVVDVPGLIEGASQGKWLWNEFLRHILKAKVFAFVMDLWRYDDGIKEFLELIDEILLYIKDRFVWSNEFGKIVEDVDINIYNENWNIFLDVIGDFGEEKKLILKKIIYVILNKYDLIEDKEILNEHIQLLNKDLQQIDKSLLLSLDGWSLSVISCFSHYWVDEFVQNMSNKLRQIKTINISEFEVYDVEENDKNYITDKTDEQLEYLIEEWYIEESTTKYIKIWEIYDPELSYYTYVLPWWNDEAEIRFWDVLSKKWILRMWESAWISRWDVLKIRSIYEWVDDRYIMWN